MKTIIYIHGLSSSGASGTAKNIQLLLPEFKVVAPDLPIDPNEALSLLLKICKELQPDLVIGTSMGGMFAQKLRGYKKILVNPAFHVSEFMRKNLGVQPFLNPRENKETEYKITESLCDAYLQLEEKQFEGIDHLEQELTWALFGENDKLVNCKEEFCKYYNHALTFPGEHRLTFEDIKDSVVPLGKAMLK